MLLWKRALLLGLLAWPIPFAAGFALFPLKNFRARAASAAEAAAVGGLWLAA